MKDEPEIKRGTIYHDQIGPIRVMVVQDGYAMVRRPGAMPFVKSVKEVRFAMNQPPQLNPSRTR